MDQNSYQARAYIDGAFRAMGDSLSPVFDKSTGQEIGISATCSPIDVGDAVDSARRAGPEWAASSAVERSGVIRDFARALETRWDELVELDMRETGGTKEKAEEELWAATNQLHNSASQAQETAGQILQPYKRNKLSLSRQVPLGVIGIITPWNYPLSLAMRAVSPAIAFGNTVVLKPSELTPILGGQIIAEAADHAGIPPGVLNVVPGTGSIAGDALAANAGVDVVSFTGSYKVGSSIAAHTALTGTVCQLELGGDNALIVLEDADIQRAAACGVWASLWFQGQTCISIGRHLVHESIASEYTEAVLAIVSRLRMGNPVTDDVDLGPLISEKQLLRVHDDLVLPSVALGAKVLAGATFSGPFYHPTVLGDVTPGMPIFEEETFGPVIPITTFRTEDDAIALANSQRMLMSSVFGGDILRALSFAEKIKAGEVHVNDGYARHGGENQAASFTHRQWIGIQRQDVAYPEWAERGLR